MQSNSNRYWGSLALVLAALVLAALVLTGCGESDDASPDAGTNPTPDTDAIADSGEDPDGGSGSDTAEPADTDEPTASWQVDEAWCERAIAGAPSDTEPEVALSEAHALVRFFGTHTAYSDVDDALADALEAGWPIDDALLGRYAEAVDSTCVLPAVDPSGFGAASVELRGTVAWLRPGDGAIDVPAEATAIVLDLRDLTAHPGLRDALDAAASAAFADPIGPYAARVRVHSGMADQYFFEIGAYSALPLNLDVEGWSGNAAIERPVAVAVPPAVPPVAAEFAASLRVAQRVWLIGSDIEVAVAESTLAPIGDRAIITRTKVLGGGSPWPDVIEADYPADDLDTLGDDWLDLATPEPVSGPVVRGPLSKLTPYADLPIARSSTGSLRAALLVFHGALRRFFPYFGTVPDTIDDALLAELNRLEGSEPAAPVAPAEAADRVRALGHSIVDGHQFVYDLSGTSAGGLLPLLLDHDASGTPRIRRSLVEDVFPGDSITSFEGVAIEDWYEEQSVFVSAASDGYTFDLVGRRLTSQTAPVTLGLVSPTGEEREVVVEPRFDEAEVYAELGSAPSLRPNGWLDDVSAPNLYYLNMASEVSSDDALVFEDLAEALTAEGIVVDMRGYPRTDHYGVAARLMGGSVNSPRFIVPTWRGPTEFEWNESSFESTAPTGTAYDGPVVLLVGPRSVSAAENFSMMLVDSGVEAVIGRRSAATNGNITGALLPGRIAATFTGMEVLFPDGSLFHGVGIEPTIPLEPTPQDIAEDLDPVLNAAIEELL